MRIKEKYKANIVGFWDFRKGSLIDQTGNGFNGVVSGTNLWGATNKGRSFRVKSAASSGLTVGKVLGTSASIANLTIAAQFKPNSLDGALSRIIEKYTDVGSTAGSIIFDVNNTGRPRFILSDSTNTLTTCQSTSNYAVVGYPILLAGTFNGTTKAMRMYINGNIGDGGAATATFTESVIPAYDLSWKIGLGSSFSGVFDFTQVLVFDVALTAAEISQLYEEMEREGHYDLEDIRHLDNTYDAFDITGADELDCYVTDGRGWNETLANVTTGFLDNTGFLVNTGTWKVSNRGTLDGRKVLECVANGQLQMNGLAGVSGWTTNTFELVSGTPTLTKNADNIQIDAVAGDKVGIINLTSF